MNMRFHSGNPAISFQLFSELTACNVARHPLTRASTSTIGSRSLIRCLATLRQKFASKRGQSFPTRFPPSKESFNPDFNFNGQ
jgi:hypothetical protein